MIAGQSLGQWIAQSVLDPRSVAEEVMALGLPREPLWMALIALSLLNAIFFSLPLVFNPAAAANLPPFMQQPFIFAFASFASAAITVFGLYWTGRTMGGQGSLDQMLAVMAWLQFLQVVLQVVSLVVSLIMPPVAALISLIALPLGLWICVNFVDCVHGFGSLLKALAVMVLWVVGLILGLSLVLGLLGVSPAVSPTGGI